MTWFRRLRDAPVTTALIAANLLVYGVMAAVSGHLTSFDNRILIEAGATVSGIGLDVSRWRWLTAAFIHVNLLHIAMNLWVLGQIGALSERALGRGLLAATYVVTGTVGNLLSTALAASSGQPTISAGASGAIMGLIGMATVYAWRSGQRAAAKSLAFNIVFVLGVGLSMSARGIKLVDNAAHIGGLVVGALVGLVRAAMPKPLPRAVDIALIGVAFAVSAAAFAVVQLSGG